MSDLPFTTCELSDALIKLGLPHAGLIPDVHLYSPVPPDPNICLSGPAYTVQMVHSSNQTAPKPSTHFVDTAPPKSVIVIDVPSNAKNAVWGGLMTAGAQANGVAGVVISGRCRDLTEHRATGFPVFARGLSTLGQSSFVLPSAINVPLVIQPQDNTDDASAFPAITIEPGDWIVADQNGVICVPRDLVHKVVELAKIGKVVEAKIAEDIEAGKGVQASLTLHSHMALRQA